MANTQPREIFKMAQEYDNELSGVIFRQEEKKTDKSPDYWGKCQVDQVEYKLSGWIKEGKKGKFISFELTPADEQQQPRRESPPMPEYDGDLPF